ncbi:hypothetical protein BDW60DRAFT_176978 [Aspergillus nidulans var. acristatus]
MARKTATKSTGEHRHQRYPSRRRILRSRCRNSAAHTSFARNEGMERLFGPGLNSLSNQKPVHGAYVAFRPAMIQ